MLINILLDCSLKATSLTERRTIHETKDSQYVELYDIQRFMLNWYFLQFCRRSSKSQLYSGFNKLFNVVNPEYQ